MLSLIYTPMQTCRRLFEITMTVIATDVKAIILNTNMGVKPKVAWHPVTHL